MRNRWIGLGLTASLLLLAVPALADHTPNRLKVPDETIAEPVAPAGEPANLVLDVRVPCQDDEQASAFTKASIAEAPAFVDLGNASAENETTGSCHDANDTLSVGLPVEIGLTKQAPAFQETTIALDVHVTKNHTNGTRTQLGPARAEIALTPGYFNLYNVRLEQKIAQSGPDESVRFPIAIDNFSNGATQFTFEVVNPNGVPDGFEPVVPSKLVLEANAAGGTSSSGTTYLDVFTPFHNGYVNEVGAVQLRIHSAYAAEPHVNGSSQIVSTLTKVSGLYMPGPGAVAALAALVGVAGLIGRKH